MLGIVQHINNMCAADSFRIINACIFVGGVLTQLGSPRLSHGFHILFAAEVQASGRACLDARWLEPRAHPIRAKRTLINFLSSGIEFRDIERTAGDAILATDAVLLLEIDDA